MPDTVIVITMKQAPSSSSSARNNASSEEEESDEEIVLPVKKKSFGFRVAQQANPAQAAQQVLSQIGNLASQRQANEVVVETAAVAEKSEAEKKALEERKRLQDAQALAKAQQAAALQAAAARVAQAQANGGAAKAQEEAIARAREAQARAQQEAQAKQQAALKAQQEAQAKQQQALQKAQQEAQKAQQEAIQKAQKEAQAKQIAAQKAQQEAQLAAQKEAHAKQLAAQKAQQEAQLKLQKAQQEAQAKQQQQQQQQKTQPAQQKTTQQTIQKTSQPVQQQNGAVKQGPQVPQKFQNGALANSQPIQQEVHAAAGPKWSRTPSKVQTQGPQPEAPRTQQIQTPQGNSALRQTAQIQEQQLAQTGPMTKTTIVAAKPHIQADHLSEKFVEKQEENLGKLTIERGKQLDGAKKWMVDSAARENHTNPAMQLEHGPKAVILDNDACWQTQRRVAAEIQQPQVGRIQIPELSEKEIQRTIVAQPASYHKVAWNEFPEEAKYELGAAPRTKTQEWTPVNQEQIELQRSLYRPSRISAVWPPPQDEILKEGHSPMVVKASDDTAWIQQDQNGVVKQTVWGNASRINRVWPPPEHDNSLSGFSGPQHMPVVQWPPPEAEQHEREQVEVLQKHIPTKRMERQWPPPPPQYHVVESTGEIETRYNPAEQQQTTIIQQEVQPVNSLKMGHIHA